MYIYINTVSKSNKRLENKMGGLRENGDTVVFWPLMKTVVSGAFEVVVDWDGYKKHELNKKYF